MNEQIHCKACNCVHHDGKCTCTADHIDVGCTSACTCDQTECATFEMKK